MATKKPVQEVKVEYRRKRRASAGTPSEMPRLVALLDSVYARDPKIVDLTHKPDGAWNKNYDPEKAVIISNKDILAEYNTTCR